MAGRGKQRVLAADESFELTFIALMLLLLCFMVILVSLAQLEGNRFRKAIGSVKGALAMLSDVSASSMIESGGEGVLPNRGRWTEAEQDALVAELQEVLESEAGEDLGDWIQVERVDSQVKMTLGDQVLFPLGEAALDAHADPVLDAVASFLKLWPGGVTIVGHTCDLPIHTRDYPSNWELSMARAVSLASWLERHGVAGERIRAEAHGDRDPLVPNDSPAHRQKNRRVEILLEMPEWDEAAPIERAANTPPLAEAAS